MKQIVPRWLSTDDAIIDAYVALIDKVCPCVILVTARAATLPSARRSSVLTRSKP